MLAEHIYWSNPYVDRIYGRWNRHTDLQNPAISSAPELFLADGRSSRRNNRHERGLILLPLVNTDVCVTLQSNMIHVSRSRGFIIARREPDGENKSENTNRGGIEKEDQITASQGLGAHAGFLHGLGEAFRGQSGK